MKILIKNHFENAMESLRANRLRTSFSILGVLIGIASITAILSLFGGAKALLNNQASNVNNSTAVIRSGKPTNSSDFLDNSQRLKITNTLTEKDTIDINKLSNITATPLATFTSSISTSHKDATTKHIAIVGSYPSLLQSAGLSLGDGQFIDENHGVVIGKQLAIDLFGTEHALGNLLKMRGESLTITGILKPADNSKNYLGIDFDRALILPITKSKQFTQNVPQIQQIAVVASDEKAISEYYQQVNDIIKSNHHDDDYYINTGSEILSSNKQLMSALAIIVAFVAGISLIIGGIGIMNVMLVSVAERQREVGIRKSLGATSSNIISQFLIEAIIISLLGSFLGYVIGAALAFLISSYLPFMPVLEWQSSVLAIIIALAIGIIFGIYPAAKAAQRNPVESLRY